MQEESQNLLQEFRPKIVSHLLHPAIRLLNQAVLPEVVDPQTSGLLPGQKMT